MRANDPSGSQAIKPTASSKCRRILRSPLLSMAASALAMPLTNGSTPINPASGRSRARAIIDSPPPKPISRFTSPTGTGKQRAKLGGRRAERSSASRGRSVAKSRAWLGRSRCPLRRPKNARGCLSMPSITVMLRASAEHPVNTGRAEIAPALVRRCRMTGPSAGRFRHWAAERAVGVDETRSTQRAFERVGEIGSLPRKPAVFLRSAPEVTVSRGAPVNRPAELESTPDVGRAERE